MARSALYSADINFGLGDISERLRTLYFEMSSRLTQGYGKISANIVNDLISGEYKNKTLLPGDLPSQESLDMFFSRLKDSEKDFRRPSSFDRFFNTPNIDPIYSGNVADEAKPFLHYFIDQLNSVISESRETEELVEAFKNNCNRYLADGHDSADSYSVNINNEFDRKKIVINMRNLQVKVTGLATDDEVSLESLSSGEKQMISLFARLYLYKRKKIVLIDEPELSLSLDWQRHILPDILRAPTCQQLIGITHSPFIFDNELEPHAGSLNLRSYSKKTKSLDQINIFDTPTDEGEDE